ncbi:MAG TPA: Ku protein [Planktothrix sp.]|jgi:DNA end-binding protein Ku
MAARAIWSGVITFGMVSIPVKMYTATENKDISFNQLHSPCKSRIKEQKFCQVCDRKIESEEIEKGYEYGKGQYVVISKDDLEKIPLPSKGAIEITSFVQLEQIDPVQYEKSYFIEPDEAAKKPFALFMRAIQEKGMIAIAKVAIRSKERLCCLRPVDGTLVMHTLLYPDEIRIERGRALPDVQVSDKELAMAGSLIDLMTEEFEPEKYKDQYREALMQVIEAKAEGRELATAEVAPQPNVVDLMDALRASMENIKARKSEPGAEPVSAGAKASGGKKKRATG